MSCALQVRIRKGPVGGWGARWRFGEAAGRVARARPGHPEAGLPRRPDRPLACLLTRLLDHMLTKLTAPPTPACWRFCLAALRPPPPAR